MKKTLHILRKTACLLVVLMLFTMCGILGVSAASEVSTVSDGAGLLTGDQLSKLQAKADELSEQYQADFVIVTVNSLGGKTPKAYANDYYDDHRFGRGTSRDGMLMLIAMDSRDYYFLTNGAPTEKLAQAGGLSVLENKVVSHLSNGDYYAAFDIYLDTASAVVAKPLSAPGASNPAYNDDFVYIGFDDIPYEPSPAERWQRVGIFALIGAAAGFLTTFIMKRGMKTARAQKMAMNYVRPGSFHLTRQQDIYLYRTRTRVRVQSNNNSGGGGGRSGGSRGGGGGKF